VDHREALDVIIGDWVGSKTAVELIVTCDANALAFPDGTRFDRVVSVEMFEHMRNYETLLARVASWMAPSATLFVHIFTHVKYAYPFEVRDETDWMAK
jgi:cyclopropane-fatty-acyl-phospholipid synthase